MKSDRANLLTAAVPLIFAVASIVAVTLPGKGFVMVVGWPGDGETRMLSMIMNARGSFVRRGAMDWIAIAYSDADDFPAALRRSGAALVLASRTSAGCLALTEEKK